MSLREGKEDKNKWCYANSKNIWTAYDEPNQHKINNHLKISQDGCMIIHARNNIETTVKTDYLIDFDRCTQRNLTSNCVRRIYYTIPGSSASASAFTSFNCKEKQQSDASNKNKSETETKGQLKAEAKPKLEVEIEVEPKLPSKCPIISREENIYGSKTAVPPDQLIAMDYYWREHQKRIEWTCHGATIEVEIIDCEPHYFKRIILTHKRNAFPQRYLYMPFATKSSLKKT